MRQPTGIDHRPTTIGMRNMVILVLTAMLALALRLLVWRWHELYPLSGDENEYFNQALTLLRDHRYVELQLMRPPLYTVFLAATMYVFDSLVQRLRLVQEIISALTVLPMYALAAQLFGDRRVALVAALLVALNYTLAAHATELLSETLFVFGLTVFFWLLLCATNDQRPTANDQRPMYDARLSAKRTRYGMLALAGLTLGALMLVRSVALPLLPLGILWIAQQAYRNRRQARFGSRFLVLGSIFILAFCLVVLPWTFRNYVTYGAPILVDTTGAENLWLDNNPAGVTPNDPLGREAAKRQLYALGDDRAARQRLATANGIAQISAHPGWFAVKMWGETQKFFGLEYFDDLRERRAIWVPLGEVWLRLVLGDGMWLMLLVAGIVGLTRETGNGTRDAGNGTRETGRENAIRQMGDAWHDVRWIFILWIAYTLATNIIFHVELRYRLPIYPAIIPFAALALSRFRTFPRSRLSRSLVTGVLVIVILAITLLHRKYVDETWRLANKHYQLWQADRALLSNNLLDARAAAQRALTWDNESALAEVALARAALISGDHSSANTAINAAIGAVREHPQPHLLRGALLRAQGDAKTARTEFTNYEAGSLQDLQSWAWTTFVPVSPPPAALTIGNGLDLGFVRGFFPADKGFRWSRAESQIQLSVSASATQLALTLASGRPSGVPQPAVTILANGREVGRIQLTSEWRTYNVPLPQAAGQLVVTLRSDTFHPRGYDRASDDARELGVQVRRAEVR